MHILNNSILAPRFSQLPRQGQADATGLPTGEVVAASNGQYICSVTAYDAKGRAALVSRTTLNGKVETSKFTYTYKGDVASTVHQVVVSGNEGFSAVTTNGYDVKSGKLSSTTETVSYYGTSASAQVAAYRYDGLGRLSQVMRSGRAGAASYTYDLHGWPTGVKSKAFEEELFYTDGCGEPRYSGSISSVEWKNPNYPKLRGYMYYYDALGRLESAVYGENVGLSTNPDRYNETVLEYTANGAIERFQRRGLKQDGQYGKIDNLNITLNGNRVVGVEDDAAPLLYKGALDFTDNTDGGMAEYTYDGDGRLTGDRNRGIAKIGYDAAGNPRRVQYMDGSVTEYVYTAAGEKLRAVHRTAAPNVSVDFGQTKELTASETLNVDSTDYYGSLTAENGEAKIYNFGGGYCTFDGTCKFHYFDRDYQGNVRAVVSTAGTIEQIMNYYPFGAPYCDNTTLNPDLQPYKYNGKEFETMHGRNAYDYGARFYDPLLPTWDRMDPLCEKYYHISPYAYCANDPVNFIDNDGEKVLPSSLKEMVMIQNTLPQDARDYVRLDASGFIDVERLNMYTGNSLNFENLRELCNSSQIIEVVLDDKFIYRGQNGEFGVAKMSYNPFDPDFVDVNGETINGLSTGESGFMGKTLFPDNEGIQNSPNNNIIVIINDNLSSEGAAETYSHEGNGHTLLYIRNGGNHKGASHQSEKMVEQNYLLKGMIIDSKRETIKNMNIW